MEHPDRYTKNTNEKEDRKIYPLILKYPNNSFNSTLPTLGGKTIAQSHVLCMNLF